MPKKTALLALLVALPIFAQSTPDGGSGTSKDKEKSGSSAATPDGSEVSSGSLSVQADHQEQTAEGVYVFDGNVRILYRDLEVQADRVEVDKVRRSMTAEGSVLVVSGKLRLSGDRAELDLDSQTGTIYDGYALLEPSFIVSGERIDKVADDRFVVFDGEITACDQSVPQWSIRSSKAKVKLEGYARLSNARIRAKKLPFLYTPYLLWPVKRDRATGLLIPHLGSSKLRGTLISEAFYLVLGRSADATLYGDYYSKAGAAPGLQIRYRPAEGLEGEIEGFYLRDKRDGTKSWRSTINHQQRLGRYFRFVVNASIVNDQTYYQNFERNLSNFANRNSFWSAFLSGNFGDYSVDVTARDDQRFYSFARTDPATGDILTDDDTIETSQIPELHASRRESKLFGWLYFSFDVDAALLERRVTSTDYDASYSRTDAFPKFSLISGGLPWLSITPTVGVRYTHWGKQTTQVPNDPTDPTKGTTTVLVDEPLSRTYGEADLEIIGPRFSKIWEKEVIDEDTGKPKVKKRKHVIEPQIYYKYISSIDSDTSDAVPLFDNSDVVRPLNLVKYGIVNRFFVKRRYDDEPDPLLPPTEYHYIYDTTCNCYQKRAADSASNPSGELSSLGEQVFEAPPDTEEQVHELVSFSLFQSFSLDPDLGTDYGIRFNYRGSQYIPGQALKRYSPLIFQFNYNPTRLSQIQVGADYDLGQSATAGTSNTGTTNGTSGSSSADENKARFIRGFATVSLKDKRNRWIELAFTDNEDFLQRQLRLSVGWSVKDERWRFEAHQYYDLKNSVGDTGLKQQSYLVNYNAQCIGIIVEYSRQEFLSFSDDVYRVALTLPNVGTFLDLNHGSSGIFQGNRFGGSRGSPF
ncbi:MAG: LPS assembly protein LptD [Acidobacteriota bacterium]